MSQLTSQHASGHPQMTCRAARRRPVPSGTWTVTAGGTGHSGAQDRGQREQLPAAAGLIHDQPDQARARLRQAVDNCDKAIVQVRTAALGLRTALAKPAGTPGAVLASAPCGSPGRPSPGTAATSGSAAGTWGEYRRSVARRANGSAGTDAGGPGTAL